MKGGREADIEKAENRHFLYHEMIRECIERVEWLYNKILTAGLNDEESKYLVHGNWQDDETWKNGEIDG
jgi:hypothetical protein